jgi:hypothetical protein
VRGAASPRDVDALRAGLIKVPAVGLRCGLIAWVVTLCACGPVSYTIDIASAEHSVSDARADNAGYYAPYELSFAEAHLEKAHEEAARGHYEDAIALAQLAETYAKRARELSGQQGGLGR